LYSRKVRVIGAELQKTKFAHERIACISSICTEPAKFHGTKRNCVSASRWTGWLDSSRKDRIEFLRFADGATLDANAAAGRVLVPFGETLSRGGVAKIPRRARRWQRPSASRPARA
jgi:hypothetical protein